MTRPDDRLVEDMKAELANVMRGAISISRASPYWDDRMREGCLALAENICSHLEIDFATIKEPTP